MTCLFAQLCGHLLSFHSIRKRKFINYTRDRVLDKFSDHIAEHISYATTDLEENQKPMGYKKLKGRNSYSIRVGDSSIINDIVESKFIINMVNL